VVETADAIEAAALPLDAVRLSAACVRLVAVCSPSPWPVIARVITGRVEVHGPSGFRTAVLRAAGSVDTALPPSEETDRTLNTESDPEFATNPRWWRGTSRVSD
jgi:hypothetical protein